VSADSHDLLVGGEGETFHDHLHTRTWVVKGRASASSMAVKNAVRCSESP
jgi:hypothetical protein